MTLRDEEKTCSLAPSFYTALPRFPTLFTCAGYVNKLQASLLMFLPRHLLGGYSDTSFIICKKNFCPILYNTRVNDKLRRGGSARSAACCRPGHCSRSRARRDTPRKNSRFHLHLFEWAPQQPTHLQHSISVGQSMIAIRPPLKHFTIFQGLYI